MATTNTCTPTPVPHFQVNGYHQEAGKTGSPVGNQQTPVQVPRAEVPMRWNQIPNTRIVEKIVEYPQYQYREVPVSRVVEVPEVQTQVIFKEVETPVNVNVPMIQPRQAHIEQEITKNVPVPVDVTTHQTYQMPKLKPKYINVDVPIYVPRYIEVPVPAQFIEDRASAQASRVSSASLSGLLQSQTMMSLASRTLTQYEEDQQQGNSNNLPSSCMTPTHHFSQTSKLQSQSASGTRLAIASSVNQSSSLHGLSVPPSPEFPASSAEPVVVS